MPQRPGEHCTLELDRTARYGYDELNSRPLQEQQMLTAELSLQWFLRLSPDQHLSV